MESISETAKATMLVGACIGGFAGWCFGSALLGAAFGGATGLIISAPKDCSHHVNAIYDRLEEQCEELAKDESLDKSHRKEAKELIKRIKHEKSMVPTSIS